MNQICKRCGKIFDNGNYCTLCHSCFDLLMPIPTMLQQLEKDLYKKEKLAQQGWQCPICEAVMAPFNPACVNCNGHKTSPPGVIPGMQNTADLNSPSKQGLAYSQKPIS